MKKSIIGLALLAAMGAGSVNAQTSPDDYEIKDTPEGKTLYVKGKVEISSYTDLEKYLGYGEENGQKIKVYKTTVKPGAEEVYYAKVSAVWKQTEWWGGGYWDYGQDAIVSQLSTKISDGLNTGYSFLGYKDKSAFDSQPTTEESDKTISLPSPEKAYHVVIEPEGILKINKLNKEEKTEVVQVKNYGSYEVKNAIHIKEFEGKPWWQFIQYLDYMFTGFLGNGIWRNDIEVVFTLNEGKTALKEIIDYYVPGRKEGNLMYYEFEPGTNQVESKSFSFGDIVAMKSLTICSETVCNNDGKPYNTKTGQFYNHNYAWYGEEIDSKGEGDDNISVAEISKSATTRIYEAMSKLRIGTTYWDEQGWHDENTAPDIRFQKTFKNTVALGFYPLSVPFFTNSEFGEDKGGVMKHIANGVPYTESDGGYDNSYYIGLYSAQYRAEHGGDKIWGSWKEVHTQHLHPRAFQAGYTNDTQMPHYRAYEIVFAQGGTNTVTFRNKSLLKNNVNSYVKGLLPYYMADGGTYVTTETKAYWSRFAVWRHPLYYSGEAEGVDDYWHFFANPMPYKVKVVRGGYIYQPKQENTLRTSLWTDGNQDISEFSTLFLSRQDDKGTYLPVDGGTTDSELGHEEILYVFQAGDPFFVQSKRVLMERPTDLGNYFIEDGLNAGTDKEAIISYEGVLLNGNETQTKSNLRSARVNQTTRLNLEEKATQYSNWTYLKADNYALENRSERDAFTMYGGGVNIWTERNGHELCSYGYNPNNNSTTIPLGLTTYKGGEYEITADNIPAGVEMWIYKAGEPVCCLNDGAYTFSAPKSTRVDDLTLVTRGTDPTTNEEISANEQNIRAYMVGSTCRIEGLEAGMTYNVYAINGATVANGTAHANIVNVALPTPGVYVVKVVSTNNEEQVIKIKY